MRKMKKVIALTAALALAFGCSGPMGSNAEAKSAKANAKATATPAKAATPAPKAEPAKPAAPKAAQPAAKPAAKPAAPKVKAFAFEDFHKKATKEWTWKVLKGTGKNKEKGGLMFDTDSKGVFSLESKLPEFDAAKVDAVRITFAGTSSKPAKGNWSARLYWGSEQDAKSAKSPYSDKDRLLIGSGPQAWEGPNTLVIKTAGNKAWTGTIKHVLLGIDANVDGKQKKASGVIAKVEMVKVQAPAAK